MHRYNYIFDSLYTRRKQKHFFYNHFNYFFPDYSTYMFFHNIIVENWDNPIKLEVYFLDFGFSLLHI